MLKERYHQIAVVGMLIGVVLITLSEFVDRLGWLTVFGATAITLSAIVIGVYIGLLKPGRWRVPTTIKDHRVVLGVIGLLLLFLPVVVTLGIGIVSLINGAKGTVWVYALGAIILLAMAAATVDGLLIGLDAIYRSGELEEGSREDDA